MPCRMASALHAELMMPVPPMKRTFTTSEDTYRLKAQKKRARQIARPSTKQSHEGRYCPLRGFDSYSAPNCSRIFSRPNHTATKPSNRMRANTWAGHYNTG